MGKTRKRETAHGDKRPNRLRVIRGDRTVEDLLTRYMQAGHPPDDLPSPQTIAKYELMRVSIPSERLPSLALLYSVDEREIFFEPAAWLPSADILVEALQATLRGAGLPAGEADSLAQELAAHFPAAVEGALFRAGQRRSPTAPAPHAPSPRATDSK
jgi:hypothetical protein